MTREDCLKFKAEHPNLKRGEVLHQYRACYMAMKRLGCLDDLYPSKNKTYPKEITYDDCVRFKQEHPQMSRRDINSHHGKYYKAMKELGCIDVFYPSSKLVYSKRLTYDDCVKFRKEHPDVSRSTLHLEYTGFYRAMNRLNCLDELFPREIAQSYNTITYEESLKFKDSASRKRCAKPSTRPPSNPLKASPRRRSKIGERNSLLADEHLAAARCSSHI